MAQLARGEVHVQGDRLARGDLLLPQSNLAAGFSDRPLSEGHDQPALLGQRDELHGRDQAAARVLPADECLDAGKPARLEVDRRLVVEDELRLLEGRSELRLHLDPSDRVGVHLRIEERVPAFLGAGPVHRHGRVAKKVLGRLVAADRHGDADIRLEIDLRAGQLDRPAQRAHDPFHRQGRIGGGGQPVEQHSELVPAQPGDGVLAADACPQPVCDGEERRLGGAVAEAVVEAGKAAHVAVQDGHRGVVALGLK